MLKDRQAIPGGRRGWISALLALAALAALVGCGGAPSKVAVKTPIAPPAPTATIPATTAGRLTLLARQAVGQAAQKVDVTYAESDRSAVVDVTLVWLPTWRDHFSEAQAVSKQACYQAQAALWTSGVSLSKVTVIVLGQAVDDYSAVITSAYAEADLTASHARAISWPALTPDQAWARYDNEFLRPTYAPNWIYLSGR